jgi:hypothetical protein
MFSMCFLHLFVEPLASREARLGSGTQTQTEAKKGLDQDTRQAVFGTETFTHARTEERDQDHHLSDLFVIPRTV